MSPLISFINIVYFSEYRSFTSLAEFISRYTYFLYDFKWDHVFFFLSVTNSSLLAIIYFLTVCLPLPEIFWASWVVLLIKNLPANARDIRDAGSIPGSGRFRGSGRFPG